jgi:arylsulfatase A-like enzyme
MYSGTEMPEAIESDMNDGSRAMGNLDDRLDDRPTLTDDEISAMRMNYAGNVSLIDDQIGGIFETIEKRGEWDNTVVVLVPDHGEMNGDFGLIYKSNFLNSAARVPLLVRAPGVAPGRECDAPVEWFDVGATLAEYAGAELDFKQFAKPLQPCLEDETSRVRDEALCELQYEVMVTDEKWKMAVNREGQPYLLFDLEADPDELNNLAGIDEYKDVETQLRLRMFERVLEAQ